jgi:hypothetical protein
MVRRFACLLVSPIWLACTQQPAPPVDEVAPAVTPAPTAEPTPPPPPPAPVPVPAPNPEEPPAPPCTELDRLAQRVCARIDPEQCSSGTCEGVCQIEKVSWFDLQACKLHGFSTLHAAGQEYAVYLDDGQIWAWLDTLGLEPLDDMDSIAHFDPDDPDGVTMSFEVYRSDENDEWSSEYHVIAEIVCTVVGEQPRCSKPIISQYSEFEEHYNSAGRTTRKLNVGYSAELELERTDTDQQVVIVTDQECDRGRAAKRAPKARFLASGEHRLAPLLDRKLVLIEAKP